MTRLQCLVVAGKDLAGKLLAIYFPIMTLVASAFEHSIANMYIISLGLLLKGSTAAATASGLGMRLEALNWFSYQFDNLFPVTLGNIIGGSLIIGGSCYPAFLRNPTTRASA